MRLGRRPVSWAAFNTKSVVRFLALITSILGLAVGLLAVDKTATKPLALPVKKPVLKIDPLAGR